MKILALSTALHPIDFNNIIRSGLSLNPSHQHYYLHIFTSLSLYSKIEVLSLFPAKKIPGVTKSTRVYKSISFVYPKPHRSFLMRWFSYRTLLQTYLKKNGPPDIVLVDSSSRLISYLAKSLSLSNKVIIITDHPRHLERYKPHQSQNFQTLHQNWDAYITLTESLNQTFNPKQNPAFILPGFVETRHVSSPQKRPYLFFSGALYNKYGLEIILQAFLALKRKDLDFVIAGHGPESSLVVRLSQSHPTIKYVGLLDHQSTYQYQGNTILNLHPRPLNPLLDQDSIPSKLFEYFTSGVPTMSTMHPFFYPRFEKEVEWIESNTVEEWVKRIRLFLNSDQTIAIEKAQRLQSIMLKMYSHSVIGKQLYHFLDDLSSAKKESKT